MPCCDFICHWDEYCFSKLQRIMMSLINTRALQLFTGMMITQISNLNGMCILFLNLIRMILTRMIVLFSILTGKMKAFVIITGMVIRLTGESIMLLTCTSDILLFALFFVCPSVRFLYPLASYPVLYLGVRHGSKEAPFNKWWCRQIVLNTIDWGIFVSTRCLSPGKTNAHQILLVALFDW